MNFYRLHIARFRRKNCIWREFLAGCNPEVTGKRQALFPGVSPVWQYTGRVHRLFKADTHHVIRTGRFLITRSWLLHANEQRLAIG